MLYLSVGMISTILGAVFGAGVVMAEPLMKLYVRLMLRWRAHHPARHV